MCWWRAVRVACVSAIVLLSSGAGSAEQPEQLKQQNLQRSGSEDYRAAVDRFLAGRPPKIVGGLPAPEGAYPFQVALLVSWIGEPLQAHFCGGSIYNEQWIKPPLIVFEAISRRTST